MSPELLRGLDWLIHHFKTAGPRVVSDAHDTPPVLVYTDGACEDNGTTVGGILFQQGEKPQCFGARLSKQTVDGWLTKEAQTQVIGQAEIFPLLIARLTWPLALANKRVLYFIDNEAARIGMVRAYSPVGPSLDLIQACLGWDYQHHSQGWYARVCSYSNCADEPSRMVRPTTADCIVVPPVFPSGHSPDSIL